MNVNDPPRHERELARRLDRLAEEQQIAPGRIRRLVGVVVVGQLLLRSRSGVVKGATNLEFRLGTQATRVSSDVDAVWRESLEQFRDELARGLVSGWHDFTGTLVDDGEIAAPVPPDYKPYRFRVRLQYRSRPFSTLIVEVGPEEVGDLEDAALVEAVNAAEWFAALGLPNPDPIPALDLGDQIAQKLHACTSPDGLGFVNDRVHDLVDLQLARELFAGDLGDVRTKVERLFASRHRQAWPPVVTPRDGWADRYPALAEDVDVLNALDAAIAWTNELINEIATAS